VTIHTDLNPDKEYDMNEKDIHIHIHMSNGEVVADEATSKPVVDRLHALTKKLMGDKEALKADSDKLLERYDNLSKAHENTLAELAQARDTVEYWKDEYKKRRVALNAAIDTRDYWKDVAVRAGAKAKPDTKSKGKRKYAPKLTDAQVRDIRAMHKEGWKQKEIAEAMNIKSCSVVSRVVRGAAYAYVYGESE
jgi:hypothetical protein